MIKPKKLLCLQTYTFLKKIRLFHEGTRLDFRDTTGGLLTDLNPASTDGRTQILRAEARSSPL
jgi:hypothetical protein